MNDPRKPSFVGRSIPRREDHRLLTGRGQFIADLALPRMLHAAFVRSPVAHARIRSVDLSRAASAPGVAYVLSGADLAKLIGLPETWITRTPVCNEHPTRAEHAIDHISQAGRGGRQPWIV